MPVRITNRSRGLLTLQLNSGESLYLAPSEMSPSLEDRDVAANRWVQRLLDRDLISMQNVKAEQRPGSARPAGQRKGLSRK
ncbi:MAG: hypothetical protein ACM3ML_08175 [Micromonosporaceae bacterium]